MKSGKQRGKEIRAARAERQRAQKGKTKDQPGGGGAPGQSPCNPDSLAPYNSYGEPAFVTCGFYIDTAFRCIDCGREEVWSATQQKWWYEVAKGNINSKAVKCRSCRNKDRERKAIARKTHLDGVALKKQLKKKK